MRIIISYDMRKFPIKSYGPSMVIQIILKFDALKCFAVITF